jgi:asparagine synthase (glutamine-hydrolysing)
VLRRANPVNDVDFREAFNTIRHRGPDRSRVVAGVSSVMAPGGPVNVHWTAGHHRLSIVDLDDRSTQPFTDGVRYLVYNGEAYNFRDLRRQRALSDHHFTTSGDTEVVFQGLKRDGLPFLDHVNGMWALGFFESETGTLLASRDRVGKKPLFYYHSSEYFCLSSTIGAIDRFLQRSTEFDVDALKSFVVHGMIYPGADSKTHHRDVLQVPPGTNVTFRASTWNVNAQRYFGLTDFVGPTDPSEDRLHSLLADALRTRMISDRPVALLLSGGIDSSLLLSMAHAKGLEKLRCFIGDTGRSEDATYAQRSVKLLNMETETIRLGYDATTFDRFMRICRHQEKPFPMVGNAMAMAEMYEEISARGFPVAIDGTGGDELFGGYWDRYLPFAIRDALKSRNFAWLRNVLQNAAAWRTVAKGLHHGSLVSLQEVPRLVKKLARFSLTESCTADPLSDSSLSFDEAIAIDTLSGRLGDWLWQNDRNAMMSGVENRSPLLDYRLVPFSQTGYASKFRGRWNKHQLRKAFDAFTPLPAQWRVQKQGFRWSRNRFLRENREAVVDLLRNSPIVADLVNAPCLVDEIRRTPRILETRLVRRLLPIAGTLEAMRG